MRRTALWILAAVAGVLVIAGVTAAASTLSTQSIGLSSEPLTAGDRLAPTATPTPTPTATPRKSTRTPTPTPTPTVDDHGGSSGRSGSSGHGSDDHGGHGSDD
jgi:hypothetical protein